MHKVNSEHISIVRTQYAAYNLFRSQFLWYFLVNSFWRVIFSLALSLSLRYHTDQKGQMRQ